MEEIAKLIYLLNQIGVPQAGVVVALVVALSRKTNLFGGSGDMRENCAALTAEVARLRESDMAIQVTLGRLDERIAGLERRLEEISAR